MFTKKRIRQVRPSPGGFNRHLTFHGLAVDMRMKLYLETHPQVKGNDEACPKRSNRVGA
jgi:hypothetical protein